MVVLEEGAPEEVVSHTRQYLQELLRGGLGGRILTVLKELNREEPGGCGGPQTEPYVIDARGTLVKRSHVAQRERLLLAQCRVYVTFVSRIGTSPSSQPLCPEWTDSHSQSGELCTGAGDAKDLFTLLQDSAREWSVSKEVVRLQIAYTLLFALLAALVSESVGGGDPLESVLSKDSGFIRAFHEAVSRNQWAPSTQPLTHFFLCCLAGHGPPRHPLACRRFPGCRPSGVGHFRGQHCGRGAAGASSAHCPHSAAGTALPSRPHPHLHSLPGTVAPPLCPLPHITAQADGRMGGCRMTTLTCSTFTAPTCTEPSSAFSRTPLAATPSRQPRTRL